MLISIGQAILTVLAILLGSAVLAGFGLLCFLLGVGSVRGYFSYVREQPGVQKLTTALLLGPLAAAWAFVCFGLAASSILPLPALLFNWLAPPHWITQVGSWLGGPEERMVTAQVAAIAYALFVSCFALGFSLTCFLGIPEMVRKIHTFFDFIAVLFALGMAVVFLMMSILFFAGAVTGRM